MALDIFSVDGAGLQVENYIYMYHLQEFIVLPSFIDSVTESFGISWQQSTPLGRSAPIYSFQSAGPRTLQLTFDLHRDLMYQINKDVSDAKVALGDDYVDTLIKDLQACVLPDYDGTSKAVNPPVIALRVGEDIFIKGVITSQLGITWHYPLLSNGKYANMSINLSIAEIDPYDARTARVVGSYRNINTDLEYGNIYDVVNDPFYSSPFDEYGGIVGGGRAIGNQQNTQRPSSSTGVDITDDYGGIVGGGRAIGINPTSSSSTVNQPSITPKNNSNGVLDEYGGIVDGGRAIGLNPTTNNATNARREIDLTMNPKASTTTTVLQEIGGAALDVLDTLTTPSKFFDELVRSGKNIVGFITDTGEYIPQTPSNTTNNNGKF